MRVLYIAAECKPFSKAGGVGDVAGELPPALKAAGVDVEIVTPWYGKTNIDDYGLEFNGLKQRIGVIPAELRGVPVHFVKNAAHFESDYTSPKVRRPPVLDPHVYTKDYSTPYVDSEKYPFLDDALRFSFFSEACLEIVRRRKPDIVHINDWVLGYLFGRMVQNGLTAKRVISIHNIGYQGNLGTNRIRGWTVESILFDPRLGPMFTDPRPEWESINPLKLAIELAHQVNTVSPTYKREMTEGEDQSRYFEGGKGLDPYTRRADSEGRLHGILNGFEYAAEPTAAKFESLLAEKAAARAALVGEFRKPVEFVLGFVGRAVEQKFKLLAEKVDGKSVLEHLLDIPGVGVSVVATGQKEYEAFLKGLSTRPNLAVTLAFDRVKAKQISLGADVFLMPSLFEPCGITQMESLSCATPPLVRWTGGLVDTVRPHTAADGTGFGFDGATQADVLRNLIAAVLSARELFTSAPEKFRELQRRGYQERFSWKAAAKQYVSDVYEPAMKANAAI
ncbi:MAG: glycogen/starch synthase [Planctomycetales bacterium]|nr:glycogen/starch synthase [Planctomycetales bacterium]